MISSSPWAPAWASTSPPRPADHAEPVVLEQVVGAAVVRVDHAAAVLAGPRPHEELLDFLEARHVRGRHQHGPAPSTARRRTASGNSTS